MRIAQRTRKAAFRASQQVRGMAAQLNNHQRNCNCGSGYMPTILELSRRRWACLSCYAVPQSPEKEN